MTYREFLLSVVNGTGISEDTMQKARELLVSHDASNAKRKSADSKEKREVRERVALVRGSLSDVPQFADSIAESIGLSVGQVRSALSALVRDGIADKGEVKVGKTRKMAYTLHIGE